MRITNRNNIKNTQTRDKTICIGDKREVRNNLVRNYKLVSYK